MEYYYDLILNFDEYPINYYEWNADDELEHIIKIPIFHVQDIKKFISYEAIIATDEKNIVLSDGVNAVALELIDKKVAYLSFMAYQDELSINDIAHDMPISDLEVTFGRRRNIPRELREDLKIKRQLLCALDNYDADLLKYIYYYLTNKVSNNISQIKTYLKNDIRDNFNEKYRIIYDKIINYI